MLANDGRYSKTGTMLLILDEWLAHVVGCDA